MISKDLSVDTTRTTCLRPEHEKPIETGDLISSKDKVDIEAGDLLLSKSKADIEVGDLLLSESKQDINTGSLLTGLSKEDIETGNLLTSAQKQDIQTGALLTAKNKADIATGLLIPAYDKNVIVTGNVLAANALPSTSGFPLNYARIGYDNALTNGSASATNDDADAFNLLIPSTYDKWRPTVDASVTLIGTSKQCNYVGVAAHNFGTDGVTLKIEISNGGANTTIYDQLVLNNKALFIRFSESAYDRVIMTLTGVNAPEVGVVFLGLELEMMRPIYAGHRPSVLSASDKMSPQMSDGGQFLGKQIVRQGFETSADFQHLTSEWYRSEFQPFVDHAKTLPYFWAWNLLEHPEDIIYGWTNQNISPALMGIRNWLEVSFEIQGHE